MGRVYDRADFRALPRERCAVRDLIGGECAGEIAHHHVHPISLGGPEDGRTVPVCARHHPSLEALARRVHSIPEWKTCHHDHPTAEGRAACERKLNRLENALTAA